MKSIIFPKFIAIQFFVIWIVAAFLSKGLFIRFFVSEIALFSLIALFCWHRIYNNITKPFLGKCLFWTFFLFFIHGGVMLLISFNVDLTQYWLLPTLLYDPTYIYRHFMIVAELLLPFGLGYCLHRSKLLYNVKTIYLCFLVIAIVISVLITKKHAIYYSGYLAALFSLISLRTNKMIFLIFIPFIFTSQTAFVIASFMMVGIIVLRKSLLSFFSESPTFKIISFLLIISLFIYIYSSDIYQYILKDANSLWRLTVWTNEIETLAKTKYLGVGFGTSYVTWDIYYIINNDHMFLGEQGKIFDRLFLVANHNSFLNMFYRLGVYGGILFLMINILVYALLTKCYSLDFSNNRKYIWWALANYMYNTIIIFLNPGMEMLQFAINYIMSLSLVFAVIFSSNCVIQKQKNV